MALLLTKVIVVFIVLLMKKLSEIQKACILWLTLDTRYSLAQIRVTVVKEEVKIMRRNY